MLLVSLLLQPLLVGLADLPLRGQALLRHPRAQHGLDEAEELLHVGLQLGVRHLRRQVGVGAHLQQQVVAEVHGLVAAAAGHEGGLVGGGLAAVADAAAGAFAAATRVGFHHFFGQFVRRAVLQGVLALVLIDFDCFVADAVSRF